MSSAHHRDDNRVDDACERVAPWPGSRSATRNARLVDRAAKPEQRSSHGHRARRPRQPRASARGPDRDVPARDAGRCPAAPTRTSGPGATTRSTSIAARAAYVWDIDGNEYIDLRMGYGPVILGHGDARVDDYVNERMRKRRQLLADLARTRSRRWSWSSELTGWVDKARMTVSGTEATMHAMRIARAYTGRDQIVKFEGQYHGVHDYALISVAPDDMSELGDADDPVAAGLGPRHPRGRRRHGHPGALQRHRGAAPDVRARRRGDRRDHRRAGPRQRPGDHAQAGLPPGDARADRGVRRRC